MKKIIIYNELKNEKPFIKRFADQHPNLQVQTTSEPLTAKTVSLAKGADGISFHFINDDPTIYAQLKQFNIHVMGVRQTGYNQVNLSAATKNGIQVVNVPGYSPRSVAEMALTHVMYLLRHIGEINHREAQKDYLWAGDEAREIHNLTVGIIGTGKIGATSAQIYQALGAKVIGSDPYPNQKLKNILTYVSLKDLLRTADIIVVHAPLLKSTHHMIGAAEFKQMKSSAIFVNVARGGIVDTPALIEALKKHEISAAGIDTIEDEGNTFNKKLTGSIPNKYIVTLKRLPNVLITPHVAFDTDNSIKNLVDISLGDVYNIINGKGTQHQVNK